MSVHVQPLEFPSEQKIIIVLESIRKGIFVVKIFDVLRLFLFKDLDQQQTPFRSVETYIRQQGLFVMLTVEFFLYSVSKLVKTFKFILSGLPAD